MWSPIPRSQVQKPILSLSLELIKPHSHHCHKPPDLNQPAPRLNIRLKYPPSSTLTNHLILPFQQAFCLSWGYKNWLLAHERHWLSLEPAHCTNSTSCSDELYSLILPHICNTPLYLCSLLLINTLPSAVHCVWKFFPNPHTDQDPKIQLFFKHILSWSINTTQPM